MAIGSFWEIGEFTMDKLFETNNQKSLDDTMFDLVFDFLGAMAIGIIVSIYYDSMRLYYNGKEKNKGMVTGNMAT